MIIGYLAAFVVFTQLLQPKCLKKLPNVPSGPKLLSSENRWDGGMTECKGPKQQQAKEAWKMVTCLEGSDLRGEWDGKRSGCRQRPDHMQALQNTVRT